MLKTINDQFQEFNNIIDNVRGNIRITQLKFIDYIDKIYYINLESRPDRNKNAIIQLRLLDPTLQKVERVEGVVYTDDNLIPKLRNAVGCSKAHINVAKKILENKYNNVLVFEDDFNIKISIEEFDKYMCYFIKNIPVYSFLCLGTGSNLETIKHNKLLYKVLKSWTTTGYMISNNIVSRWINHAEMCTQRLIKTKKLTGNVIDEAWFNFFGPNSNSYTFNTKNYRLITQIPGYSDIDEYYINWEK